MRLHRANQEATRCNQGEVRMQIEESCQIVLPLPTHTKQLHQVENSCHSGRGVHDGLRGAVLTAGRALLGATVAIQAFGRAVSSAAGLESELNVFRLTAGATADEMERIGGGGALGRDITLPGSSGRRRGRGHEPLARAGLEVEDSIAGARGVLQLAAAAQLDNARATELAASALNAFQLAGEDAVHVADMLAVSANESQGSITDMGIGSPTVGSHRGSRGALVRGDLWLSYAPCTSRDQGSDAGTSFRVALQRLIAPTKAAQGEIEKLNLNLRDVEGDLRPEVFFELGDALSGMSRAQQQATLVTIFGADASRAAALIARENVTALEELVMAYDKQGSAAELAGARAAGFAGQVEALKNNLETLGTTLGRRFFQRSGCS